MRSTTHDDHVVPVHIAVIGEYQPGYGPQEATMAALGHAAHDLGLDLAARWVGSEAVDEETLAAADGIFLAPGPPYVDLERALGAVHHCLDTATPMTGTCSGFQHALVGLARAVGISDATHAEYGLPGTPVVTRLACSLAGTIGTVHVEKDTVAHRLYAAEQVREQHRCNYGLDEAFLSVVPAAGAVVSGRGDDGTPRIVEIPGHPFFLVALFVPQLASRPDRPHPLLTGFLGAAGAATRSGLPEAPQ